VSYKSDSYYGVVLKGDTYKGFKANYVGDGLMNFAHTKHDDIRVTSKSESWMEDCWNDFLTNADAKEEKS
jgi:hypothetical protein